MKVAFFVHRFPVISEAFIANAAAGLIDQGHTVDIYALDGGADPAAERHALVQRYRLEDRSNWKFALSIHSLQAVRLSPVPYTSAIPSNLCPSIRLITYPGAPPARIASVHACRSQCVAFPGSFCLIRCR